MDAVRNPVVTETQRKIDAIEAAANARIKRISEATVVISVNGIEFPMRDSAGRQNDDGSYSVVVFADTRSPQEIADAKAAEQKASDERFAALIAEASAKMEKDRANGCGCFADSAPAQVDAAAAPTEQPAEQPATEAQATAGV